MPDQPKTEKPSTDGSESGQLQQSPDVSKQPTKNPQNINPPRSQLLSKLTSVFILILAATILIVIINRWNSWVGGRGSQTTDDAFIYADITPLSTKVSGIVSNVLVEDYQKVKEGDLLVQLKDDDYTAQVAQAVAGVETAKAALDNLQKQKDLQVVRIAAAEADISATEADVKRTKQEKIRQESLDKSGSTIAPKLEAAVADEERFRAILNAHQADLRAQRKQLSVLDSQEHELQAELKGREATLELARINLGYTHIIAPTDGLVSERMVHVGQLVNPGTQVISIVGLKVWVVANYKETQITNIKVGDPVEIKVDSFPGVVLKAHVDTISPASGSRFALLPPDNATGNFTKVTQRIPIKIVFDNETPLNGRLRPGMSVNVKIKTEHNETGN